MERRAFGWTGALLPIFGQGTWQMEGDDRGAAVRAIRRGIDAGMTHLDTAEMYGSGAVEEIVAEAITGRRDEVFLASKVLPHNASRKGTVAACERSLRRLRTDRIDLYMLHWPGSHPLEDTLAGLEELRQKGKVLYYGVSNFDVADLERAVAIAGERRIACNQVLYHLRQRGIEHAVIPCCERHAIPVVAYSPFGSGDFPGPASPGGRALAAVAKAHGATPRQVALRFLVRRPIVFAIPKTSSVDHAIENAGAGDLALTDDDLARLDAAFPLGAPPRELPTL
jgi:diketogulonate reductase-like aldo/keto reductase